jgi:phosphoadenosine phosphosulfate reductase
MSVGYLCLMPPNSVLEHFKLDALKAELSFDPVSAFRCLMTEHPSEAVFTTSFGKEDQAISHLLHEARADIRQVTLDTGLLFKETHDLFRRTVRKYGRAIEVLRPEDKEVHALLHRDGPDGMYNSLTARKACCAVRKLRPLKRALAGSTIWITGLRSAQSPSRRCTPRLAFDLMSGMIKFNPLHDWSDEKLEAYIERYEIPVNTLHANGYPSIGCAPCTRAVEPGEHPRTGRWWWEDSTKECGLHKG